MQKVKTEALILKKKRLLDRDLLITLFTKEFGKVEVLGKGVKNITSRRLPHLQTGNLIQVVLYRKSSWSYLQETSLISAFSGIKDDREKINHQYFMFFLIDRLLPQDQKESKTYELLKKFVVDLARNQDFNNKDTAEYINLILKNLGYLKEEKTLPQLSIFIEDLINEKVPLLI